MPIRPVHWYAVNRAHRYMEQVFGSVFLTSEKQVHVSNKTIMMSLNHCIISDLKQ